jgi:cell division transport system permease protein
MNTQKSAIYASRHAIRTMQLIGATPTFVRGPFLKMGILQGFIGGIIAIALLVGLLPLIFFQIDGLHFGKEILEEKYFFVILGGILLFGTCLGFLGSYWAVNRFLHKSLDELSI